MPSSIIEQAPDRGVSFHDMNRLHRMREENRRMSMTTVRRYFIWLRHGQGEYPNQPCTGFSTPANAHAYAERHTLLAPDRYYIMPVEYPR